MSLDSGHNPPSTTVICDNPRCNASYEVDNKLGGHTFTCSRCGSRVTIRDLRAQPDTSNVVARSARSLERWSKPSSTPLLDQIIHAQGRQSMASSNFVTLFRKVTAWANAEIDRGRKRFRDRHLRSRDSIVDRQAANLAAAAAALTGKPMAEVTAAGVGKTATPHANAPQGQPARKREAIQASTDPEEIRKSAVAQKPKVDEVSKAIIASVVSLNLPPAPDVAGAATWEEFRDARAAQLRGMRATQTSLSKEPSTNALPLNYSPHPPTAEGANLAQIEDALTGESRDEIAADVHQDLGQSLIEAQELAFPSIRLPGEKDEENQPENQPQPRLSMRDENDISLKAEAGIQRNRQMVIPETIAQVQEQARKLAPEHLEQLREILRLKANEGEPDYSHHFTPEALARAELSSSQKIATDRTDTKKQNLSHK
jgi:hypothetical protein